MLTQCGNIADFIPFLSKILDGNVVDCSAKLLSSQGLGSIMWVIRARVETHKRTNDLNELDNFELVVKSPVCNKVFSSLFQPSQSCIKENGFYLEIIPTLMQLQREHGIAENELCDFFIHCYGARLSLNPDSKTADGDALLVLENLKMKDYHTGNPLNGFNTYNSMKILESIAKFHALPIALRYFNKNVFDTKVKPYLKSIDLYVNFDQENAITKSICDTLKNIKNLNQNVLNQTIQLLNVCKEFRKNTSYTNDTPYTTIVHRDLWSNNILFTSDAFDNITKIKFCDYQLSGYHSFAIDLLFFLFTTVNQTERRENFVMFIKHYHFHFVETLEKLGCPIDDYTYEKMLMEIKKNAKYELEHIILMLKVILADKDKVLPVSELGFDFILKDDHLIDTFYEQLHDFLIEFNQMGFM